MTAQPRLADRATGPGVARDLIDFVLANAQVRAYPGSRQQSSRAYRLTPRVLDHYDCFFVHEGELLCRLGGQQVRAGPSDFVILPPATPHAARSARTPLVFLSVHVQVTLPGGQDVLALLGVPAIRRVAPGSRLAGYLAGATAEWDRARGDPMTGLLMRSWARLITLELLREDGDRGLLAPHPFDPRVRECLEGIARSLGERVTPAKLAANVGVSPQHLNVLFRDALGVTAMQYLTHLRMTQAATLLDQSTQTVRAIGRQVGYDDPYHFSRAFRLHHGVSPAHWRSRQGTTPSADPVNDS